MDTTELYNDSVVKEILPTSYVTFVRSLTTASSMQENLPLQVKIAFMVFLSLILIVGVVGNTVVIYIFVRTKALRTPPNFLIVNLSVSDLAMILSNCPMMLTSIHNGSWQYGYIGCQFYAFCGAIFSFVSIGSMAAISIDRYYVICYCFHSLLNVSRRRTLITILLVWLYALIWSVLPFIGLGAYVEESYGIGCTFDFVSQDLITKVHVVLLVVGGFLSPLAAIIVCYSKIVGKVRKHGNEIRRHSLSGPRIKYEMSARRKSLATKNKKMSNIMAHYQLARVGIIASVVFCLSWGPYALMAIYSEFLSPKSTLKPIVQAIPSVFAKMSSIWNPFVYAACHTRFKKALYDILRTLFRCGSTEMNDEMRSQEINVYSNTPRGGSESVSSIKRPAAIQNLPHEIITDKEKDIPLQPIKTGTFT